MTCHPSCVCSCNQQGCGCQAANPSSVATTTATVGPTATCAGCDQTTPMRRFKSPRGAVVEVVLCPRCDRKAVSR